MDFLNATVGEAPTQIQSTTPTGGDNDAGKASGAMLGANYRLRK